MAMVSEESASELFQAQVHIWSQAFSFINFALLKSALELGIPDIIQKHGQPMTLSQLVTALPINPTKAHGIYRLMRVLVHSGYFAQESVTGRNEQEVFQYTITANSRLLLKDNPFSMSTHLLAILTPVPTEPWHFVSTWFQNDDPTPFITANGGRTFWDYARHESSLNISYNEIMASDSRLVASVVIHECKGVFFEGLNSLIDVGGGTGTLAKAISSAFPQLKCTVLDLPHVVANLQGSENLYFIEGNMFEAIPPADAVFLKWILHSWSDEDCVKILKQCKEAITGKHKGGKVLIIDIVMENNKEDDKLIEAQLYFDMSMMVHYGGRERNEKEWAKLFSDAGFSNYKIYPILGVRSLIEVYP